ncbi:hypothetical protein [Falsiroseomonas oryzae]|uniref:hypothetical protein n=1 Tax=Falsiroseomonas oryzae TaxID=2766473 RepID=UPI0022EAE02F|nr:hypothetical protein [Roseomonas sp. MO-31]
MIQVKMPPRTRRMLVAIALVATAAEWVGPVLAGALGAPMLRLAAGDAPSPIAGALEAGLVGSAIWLVFEA